ncbi:hypothetical protein BOTNAR_0027g00330 [Botryotinia narcissicola]|uniref:Uncharacterized protein n=1 Tax=Botryotinia narcissicola TaxID=278944 RepID=A0A4Z1J3W5_9HELO|nr:hypothetical protein BOTNAR_0027g00330 [Botryotinia narcissicola]
MPLDGYLSYEHPTFGSASETRGRSIIFLEAVAGYDMEPSIEARYWDETYLAIIAQSITRTSAPLTIDFPKPSFQGLMASPTGPSD